MSHRDTSSPFAVRLLKIIAGWVAVAVLFAFALWLLRNLYLDETWQQEMVRRYSGSRVPEAALPEPVTPEWDRFHLEVPDAALPMSNPPICDSCHSSHPHHESERLRAYLNMHNTFLACETCHHRPAPGEAITYAWVDDETDEAVPRPPGANGVHGAHIYPFEQTGSGAVRLGARLNEPEWMRFNERIATATGQEFSSLTESAHFELQGDPLTCGECHGPEGALDREVLGYTPSEIDRLANLEMARLLESNVEFHLPDLGRVVTPLPASP